MSRRQVLQDESPLPLTDWNSDVSDVSSVEPDEDEADSGFRPPAAIEDDTLAGRRQNLSSSTRTRNLPSEIRRTGDLIESWRRLRDDIGSGPDETENVRSKQRLAFAQAQQSTTSQQYKGVSKGDAYMSQLVDLDTKVKTKHWSKAKSIFLKLIRAEDPAKMAVDEFRPSIGAEALRDIMASPKFQTLIATVGLVNVTKTVQRMINAAHAFWSEVLLRDGDAGFEFSVPFALKRFSETPVFINTKGRSPVVLPFSKQAQVNRLKGLTMSIKVYTGKGKSQVHLGSTQHIDLATKDILNGNENTPLARSFLFGLGGSVLSRADRENRNAVEYGEVLRAVELVNIKAQKNSSFNAAAQAAILRNGRVDAYLKPSGDYIKGSQKRRFGEHGILRQVDESENCDQYDQSGVREVYGNSTVPRQNQGATKKQKIAPRKAVPGQTETVRYHCTNHSSAHGRSNAKYASIDSKYDIMTPFQKETYDYYADEAEAIRSDPSSKRRSGVPGTLFRNPAVVDAEFEAAANAYAEERGTPRARPISGGRRSMPW